MICHFGRTRKDATGYMLGQQRIDCNYSRYKFCTIELSIMLTDLSHVPHAELLGIALTQDANEWASASARDSRYKFCEFSLNRSVSSPSTHPYSSSVLSSSS